MNNSKKKKKIYDFPKGISTKKKIVRIQILSANSVFHAANSYAIPLDSNIIQKYIYLITEIKEGIIKQK